MNDFRRLCETIKSQISCTQVADRYGMETNRQGFMRCVFHNDGKPSLKLYNGTSNDDHSGFYCFSCGKSGSCIDLVSGFFGIGIRESALMIARDFGIETVGLQSSNSRILIPEQKPNYAKLFSERVKHYQRTVCDRLRAVESEMASFQFSDEESERKFCKLADEQIRLEGMADILCLGCEQDKMQLVVSCRKELDGLE